MLLVDADAALLPHVTRLIDANGFAPRWHALHGAISSGSACDFVRRSYMASSLATLDASPGETSRVPVLSDSGLCAAAPGPCDLLKVDIEGAEHELLAHYPRLLAKARHLCIEWHARHAGSGELERLSALAAQRTSTVLREASRRVRSIPAPDGCAAQLANPHADAHA